MAQPYIIGITGGSGSGKTTFINQLKERFRPEEVCFVSQDDYYLPREEQRMDKQGIRNFDLPESIEKSDLIRDLKLLLEGKTVRRREYVFNNENATPQIRIFQPAPILIVEGIFVFHFEEIRHMLDLKVFLHAKENLKVIRRIKRDQVERNYPLEDVLYRYEHHVLPTFEKYIQPYMEEADVIINNNKHFNQELEVMSGFVCQALRNLRNVLRGEEMEMSVGSTVESGKDG